jgi:hypothetical protein
MQDFFLEQPDMCWERSVSEANSLGQKEQANDMMANGGKGKKHQQHQLGIYTILNLVLFVTSVM